MNMTFLKYRDVRGSIHCSFSRLYLLFVTELDFTEVRPATLAAVPHSVATLLSSNASDPLPLIRAENNIIINIIILILDLS